MIGSETFIIVAFMCREKRTPRSLASAICSARKASSARRCMTAPSTISPALTGIDALRTVAAPSGATNSIRRSSSCVNVTERSVERKSPPDMVETCDLDSVDHAPIECGCALANDFTDAGARRSELPSRSTGLTAEPFTRS